MKVGIEKARKLVGESVVLAFLAGAGSIALGTCFVAAVLYALGAGRH